jgi:hypothetical protein
MSEKQWELIADRSSWQELREGAYNLFFDAHAANHAVARPVACS